MSDLSTPVTGTILDRILETKRGEIAALRDGSTMKELAAQCADLPPTRGFKAALLAASLTAPALIAEVKKASPSKGIIREDFDPATIARAYEAGGASCLSVLTDETYFQGSLRYLAMIREAVALPLLRKDFLLDPAQIYEARAARADAILLIVAAIPSAPRLAEMRQVAETLGMDALVEIHDHEELAIALESGATLIGVNNRNLHTFTVSLETSEKLFPLFPPGVVAVAESGILTHDDTLRLHRAGAQALLVGEALMRALDIAAATRTLLTGI